MLKRLQEAEDPSKIYHRSKSNIWKQIDMTFQTNIRCIDILGILQNKSMPQTLYLDTQCDTENANLFNEFFFLFLLETQIQLTATT